MAILVYLPHPLLVCTVWSRMSKKGQQSFLLSYFGLRTPFLCDQLWGDLWAVFFSVKEDGEDKGDVRIREAAI